MSYRTYLRYKANKKVIFICNGGWLAFPFTLGKTTWVICAGLWRYTVYASGPGSSTCVIVITGLGRRVDVRIIASWNSSINYLWLQLKYRKQKWQWTMTAIEKHNGCFSWYSNGRRWKQAPGRSLLFCKLHRSVINAYFKINILRTLRK